MNVNELYYLSQWFESKYPEINSRYQALLTPLRHNSQQPNKQPIQDHMDKLIDHLRLVDFGDLSIQQLELLTELKVRHLIGCDGVDFIKQTIIQSDYDPATAATAIEQAANHLGKINERFVQYQQSINTLGIEPESFEDEDGFVRVRICFKEEASIENLVDWKRSASEWHIIAHGIARATDQKPEDIRVVGASKGSLILELLTTYVIVRILALIAKEIAAIVKESVSMSNYIEKGKQEKLITKIAEDDLRLKQQTVKDDGVQTIISAVKRKLPKNVSEDALSALEKSIDKLVKFSEAGGTLDFVEPASNDDEEDSEQDTALAEVRQIIHDVQSKREDIRLLVDDTANDND